MAHSWRRIFTRPLDAHLERALIVAQPRPGQIPPAAELEGELVAGADHGGLARVDEPARQQAPGVVAGIVHRGHRVTMAREQHQPLSHLQPAQLPLDEVGRPDVHPVVHGAPLSMIGGSA
jgi:hypothetical protein